MNRNVLKIIACISMFIDHMGFVLFPHVEAFHLIGRIAMPIFAFFIGEGCLYTKNRKKYFLRVFILGIICQAVYAAESVITGSDGWGYLNILLTFSLSIILCCTFLYARELCWQGDRMQKVKGFALWLSSFLIIVAVILLEKGSEKYIGTRIKFDYSVFGIMLPAFVVVSNNKTQKLIYFSLGQIAAAYFIYGISALFFCALIPVVLLWLYNSQPGKKNLKYFFYLFYPLHLVLIYGLSFVL